MINFISKRYIVVKKIDHGGMSDIFLATDTYDNTNVVIKVLSDDKKKNIVDKKRLKSEVNLTTKIDSKYVVKIKDYNFDEKIQYIVMEYIEGTTLKQHIKNRVNLSNDEAVDIAKDIALALVDIHDANIIHRDIKALNVMIAEDGNAKVIDFGISVNDESEQLTKTNSIIGSVDYLAPEILDGKSATNFSDIYALGILLYQMLTGKLPFRDALDKDHNVVAMRHKTVPLPSVLKINPLVRQSVINIITKATAKNPSDRYKNAREFYNDLSTCLSNNRLYEKPIILKSKKPKRGINYYINNHWYIVGFLVFLLIIIIVITYFLIRSGI